MLWNSLTMLPYKFRMEYESDIHTRLSELRGEERTAMLFRQLTPLFHFLDYDLLNHLINKFGSRNLKENMSKYLANIDKFMEETTVHDIIKVRYFRQPNENKFYKHYSKLRAKFDGDPKDYTLKKVDAVRTRFCDTARLSRTILWLMYCDEAQSFLITWCFPAVLAPDMKDRVTTLAGLQFFTSEHVSSVSVDGQVLYPAPPPRQEAARSCNIM